MTTQSIENIYEVTRSALERHGAQDWIAGHVASAVAAAESVGNRICGLYYVESYCQQLKTGRVNGRAEPEVSQPRASVVSVDAKFGFAQPAFARGLGLAVETAREQGICSFSVCHAHTCTSLGYFTGQIAEQGMIGVGFTNASPIVAAPGGKKRVIGTNPIAFSVPDGRGGIALQFDQSTTTVALGKITMAKAAGEKIPLGWAVDANGEPTDDPDAALAGSLVSMGGYKGWGFGVMAELLASGLTGSVRSLDVKPLKAPEGPPHDLGQYYIVIDPGQENSFQDRLAMLAAAVDEDEGTRLPGRGKTPATEVEVADPVWELITSLAGRS
jgi:(2R)-3-sulfolactate dehydrogenase (NADP+)